MPVGFIDDVILTRRYVEAYYANQGDPASAGNSPMRALAQEIEMEFAQEAHDKATAAAEAKANGHHD